MILEIAAVASAMLGSICVAALGYVAYILHRREALSFIEQKSRLPDATKYENIQALLESSREEYDTVRDELASARQTIAEADLTRETLEQTKADLQQLETRKAECDRVAAELELKRKDLDELLEKLADIESEAVSTSERLAQLRKETYEAEIASKGARHEAEVATQELSELRQDVGELRLEVAELKQQREDEERNISKLTDKIEGLKTTAKQNLREVENEKERAQSDLDRAINEIDKIGAEKEKLAREKTDLEGAVDRLEAEKNSIEGHLPALKEAYAALNSGVTAQGASQASGAPLAESELWLPVLSGGSATSKAPDELEALRNLQRNLKSLNLNFDERTLYAFHTSLKSSSTSPLITLAGVSGTGKSELPRRYAQTMGINFLNSAVQPRWDSPQDLFEFYDYLEQRFRPTEITRALLQMDTVGAEDGRGWETPDDYASKRLDKEMLIILLDEMNLARVEYYFSEFLSKLETRRGVNRSNTESRKLAEIVLEVSGRSSDQEPLRVFVDENILFVGTMNEDESTLALSDKVIDRSNIMRFGSPKTIQPQTRIAKELAVAPKLLHSDWKAWGRTEHDLAEEDQRKLLTWIETIREALSGVGRPFAYRVVYGMLDYAANYPEVDNRIEFAMGDQIEQRVLPKLIGMDNHETASQNALKKIQKVLAEIDDGALQQEIQSCSRKDYFQWNGLDRT